MKKLEPGMLCGVVGAKVPENNGKIVTLVKFIGTPDGVWLGDDWWETDTFTVATDGTTSDRNMRACRLQPINPDHQPADEEWQADFKRILSGDKQTAGSAG